MTGTTPTPADPLDALQALALTWALRLALAGLVLLLGWWLTGRARRATSAFVRRARPEDAEVLALALDRLTWIGGLALTGAVALGVLGVNVSALVAGLGLTSLALGLALKDTIEQAVTGILLLLHQPFRVGDAIEVDGVDGIVTEVGIRATSLRTLDGVDVLVPNNRVFQGIIRNKSRYPTRRLAIRLNLAPGSDLARVQSAFLAAAAELPLALGDPPPTVSFDGFADDGVRVVVRFWVRTADSAIAAQSAMTSALDAAAAGAGITLASPPPAGP